MALVRGMGGVIIGGKVASSLLRDGRRVNGVAFKDGFNIEADIVILATGSWTPITFADELLNRHVFASG